ncbi:urea ABC transporter permease subunit UrtC [Lichenibacterium dinghuense]|uniref:urea ABC transporter permease subunit UrtC n=1 Tax=Lichenibacterium dinghuense TaxID=2895977 RepID=UPI001F01696C|nr:urea ABC transporter permease subunit UrtC [Lichenibacterium sp. 6Y81]
MTAKRQFEIASYVLFIALILVLPAFLGEFWLNRIAKYLVFGMLGVAICLSWGYAGILNLGQGLFFGLGAYLMAMSLKLASNTSMQQGSDTPIPDFMFWNAEPGAKPDLCCITKTSFLWIPFQSQWVGLVMAVAVPTVAAAALGAVIFKKRIAGVFISIITLALVLLARLLVIDGQPLTNGFNGLTDLGSFTLGDFSFDSYGKPTYYVVATALALVLVGTRLLVETRAGLVLQAVRDDANRARYLGFDVPNYQVFFFAVSAAIAGLAGLLYVNVAEFASPTFLDLSFSITMVVWAAVGGRNSLLGACIGAILINMAEAGMSETQSLVESWRAIIGLIFILVVLFLPRGLAGLADDALGALLGRRRGRSVAASEPDAVHASSKGGL